MDEFITVSDLRRTMIEHKLAQNVMKPEYVPPEGQQGRGGPDWQTELKGFQRDYDHQISRILGRFPDGVERQAIGEFLTEEAKLQQPRSAGCYLRATMMELRDIVAPDYLRNIARANVSPLPAEEVMASLKKDNTDPPSEVVLSEMRDGAKNAQDIERQLKDIGDRHYQSGDDYMASVADILKEQVKALDSRNKEVQIQKILQQLEAAERKHGLRPEISKPIRLSASAPKI